MPGALPMDRVLFLFMTNAELTQYRHLADGLRQVGGFQAFACGLSQTEQRFQDGLPEEAPPQGRPPHLVAGAAGKAAHGGRARLSGLLGREPFKSLRLLRGIGLNALYWWRRRREAERFIADRRIDTVVTGNDTTLYYLPVLRAAQKLGKPVVLVRTANIFYHDESALCQNSMKHLMRARMPQMHAAKADCFVRALCNRLVRTFFPRQVAETKWGKLFPYQSTDILALALAGIAPRQLWHLGLDWTRHIVASGDDEVDAIRAYGIGPERISKIGCVPFAHLYGLLKRRDELRAETCRRLGLDPARPIILMTVPAGWEHRTFTYDQQFGHLRKVFGMLCSTGAQTVASLHPLSRIKDYRLLFDEFGVAVLDRQLIDSLVFADVFLGCDNSSVLRWAIGVGLPTMNFELNPDGLHIKLHPEYPTTRDEEEFRRWIERTLRRCPVPTSELLAIGRRPMGLVVDDRFFGRLADLIVGYRAGADA